MQRCDLFRGRHSPRAKLSEGDTVRGRHCPRATLSEGDTVAAAGPRLARIIHPLVGWDKETAIWWAGACELTFHFDYMLFWVR